MAVGVATYVAISVGISLAGSLFGNNAEEKARAEAERKTRALVAKRVADGEQIIDENLIYNNNAIARQESADSFAIDKAIAIGTGSADSHTAGSGISGGLNADIDRQVELDALDDKVASQRESRLAAEGADRKAEDSKTQLSNWAEDTIAGINTADSGGLSTGDYINAAGAGFSTYLSAKK